MSELLSKYRKYIESEYSIIHAETRIAGDMSYGIGTINRVEKNLKTGLVEKIDSRETVIFRKQDNDE